MAAEVSPNPGYEAQVDALRQTLYRVVHVHNYKAGAFKAQISQSTHPIRTLSIFLESRLSEEERYIFHTVRGGLACMHTGDSLTPSEHDRHQNALRYMHEILEGSATAASGETEAQDPVADESRMTRVVGTGQEMVLKLRHPRTGELGWPFVRFMVNPEDLLVVRESCIGVEPLAERDGELGDTSGDSEAEEPEQDTIASATGGDVGVEGDTGDPKLTRNQKKKAAQKLAKQKRKGGS